MSPPYLSGSYIVIELTNQCNLACVHCAVSQPDHSHHQVNGYLDPKVAFGLFDDLAKVGAKFDTLILFWLGEPTMHPHFLRIYQQAIRMSHRYGIFGQIEVHSNALLLDDNRIDGLLNNAQVPQSLHLSLDAATAQTYHQVKGRDRFHQARQNTERLLRSKAHKKAVWPRPVMQFIVGENNYKEVGLFRQHWQNYCQQLGVSVGVSAGQVAKQGDAAIFFRQLDCPTAAEQQQQNTLFRQVMHEQKLSLPEQASKGMQVTSENLKPCAGFWKSPVIDWDGRLTTCTRDNELQNSLGNIAKTSFSQLWWGERMQQHRRQVAQGQYKDFTLCETCFIPKSLNHGEITATEIKTVQQYGHLVAQ